MLVRGDAGAGSRGDLGRRVQGGAGVAGSMTGAGAPEATDG